MEPHETSQRHHSARSLPAMMARPTLGGLLEPLFGQFQGEVRRTSLPRTRVNKKRTAGDGGNGGPCNGLYWSGAEFSPDG
jgi:hypothetical protein